MIPVRVKCAQEPTAMAVPSPVFRGSWIADREAKWLHSCVWRQQLGLGWNGWAILFSSCRLHSLMRAKPQFSSLWPLSLYGVRSCRMSLSSKTYDPFLWWLNVSLWSKAEVKSHQGRDWLGRTGCTTSSTCCVPKSVSVLRFQGTEKWMTFLNVGVNDFGQKRQQKEIWSTRVHFFKILWHQMWVCLPSKILICMLGTPIYAYLSYLFSLTLLDFSLLTYLLTSLDYLRIHERIIYWGSHFLFHVVPPPAMLILSLLCLETVIQTTVFLARSAGGPLSSIFPCSNWVAPRPSAVLGQSSNFRHHSAGRRQHSFPAESVCGALDPVPVLSGQVAHFLREVCA